MAKKENTIRINVNMSKELLAAVDQYAEQWSISRSGAVCVMVSQFMEQSQAMRTLPTVMTIAQKSEQVTQSAEK